MQLVRLTLVERAGDWDDMFLDVFVGDDGRVADNIASYGRWGAFEGEPWPFAMRPKDAKSDARIDFGTGLDEGIERFGTINIYSKPLKRGELTTFRHGEDEICFSITHARLMPSGEDFFLTG